VQAPEGVALPAELVATGGRLQPSLLISWVDERLDALSPAVRSAVFRATYGYAGAVDGDGEWRCGQQAGHLAPGPLARLHRAIDELWLRPPPARIGAARTPDEVSDPLEIRTRRGVLRTVIHQEHTDDSEEIRRARERARAVWKLLPAPP
jgi:hypothetical protein